MKFEYEYEDRFAELKHDDKQMRKILDRIFKYKIQPHFEDHSTIGIGHDEQKIYHVCYDCNIELWSKIFEVVKRLGERCNVNLDWDAIRHVTKFTFIWMPPHGTLKPHTAHALRTFSAFNIPLRGITKLDMYDEDLNLLERREYTKPCFLNTYQPHGVNNDCNEERLILKTHLQIVPMQMLKDSYMSDKVVSPFNFEMPWRQLRKTGEL
jgi:hypothetical protein|tara:strand:- start:6266 stop:6892 length:627 start_codon:yes stop_codon:yes gene_type:complete